MNSFFVELQEFETVGVTGPDAAKFLQGQLTCDVYSLAENTFTYGAACNNKGRIFASFILARHDTDFHVLLADGLAATFIANLQKFIPFYKCSMHVLADLKSIGLAGTEASNTLAKLGIKIPPSNTGINVDGKWLYSLQPEDKQFILSISEHNYVAVKSSISPALPEKTAEQWKLLNIYLGHFPFAQEDVDKYTPQELNFDQTGYVSFSKGCYTGQEIIARMHYRGKTKKRLYVLQLENGATVSAQSPVEIFDNSGKSFGFSLKQLIDTNHTLVAIASLPIELDPTSLRNKEGKSFSCRPMTTVSAQ
jgi:tRNA-modifying protein YgfZ